MGDVDDRWFRTEKDPMTGQPLRVPTNRHGIGKRYRARWRDDRGEQHARSFDRKREAEAFLSSVHADLARGSYVDPNAGKIRLEEYLRNWLKDQTFDESTRQAVASRFRVHVYPGLGHYELRAIRPSTVKAWSRSLQKTLAPATVRVIFANLSGALEAAIDDGLIARNPLRVKSVRPPAPQRRRVVPWSSEWVAGMIEALPLRYSAMIYVGAGLGLRQGEIFGLAADDLDTGRELVHVRRQVKIVNSQLVFALPKGGKERDVPLSQSVFEQLQQHMNVHPPTSLELPWGHPDGRRVSARLLFRSRESKPLNRNYFNSYVWRKALRAVEIPVSRENGMHALRHRFASVALDGGVSVKELAEWLGHSDPGFTLRVYTHLMPRGANRMRRAIDASFE